MNKKQELFIKSLVEDARHNATTAARAAGYSERSAAVTGCRLLKDPEIKAAYEKALEEFHKQNTAEADEVIEFLTEVMRGENEVENIPVFVGEGEQAFKKGKPSAKDRLKAAELLGKYYGMFTDKTQIDGIGAVQIIDNIPEGDGNAGT